MIYVGYPCIGKTSIAGIDGFIDLESSLFNNGSDNWEEQYVSVANELSKQGYKVLISSYKKVRDILKEQQIDFICVTPNLGSFDLWFDRLVKRYKEDPSDKNLRALQRCATNYRNDISDLMSEEKALVIPDNNCDDLKRVLEGKAKTVEDLWDSDCV